jgi:pSer/pThr/pTyr-binding forkhead associated (FHA) protein
MANEKTSPVEECPACGESRGEDEVCCDLSAESKSQPIPVIAEVHCSQGVVVPIATRWLRIGRESDNDIVVDDDGFVSRYHAWITFERDRFWLEDLGSTNGTILNGQPLARRELLASGDKIKIGESEMTFVLLEKTGAGS